MSLISETVILAAGITLFSSLPLFLSSVRRHSKLLFLIGTGAMFGLCFFDLIPDVFEIGGKPSLYIMGTVWAIYSLAHLFHIGHHESEGAESSLASSKAFFLFYGSLITHCFSSGLLLALSHDLSLKIASTVFLALVAHKGYEALMLSSILMKQNFSKRLHIFLLSSYALSLPLGVLTTELLKENLSQSIVVVVSSIAVGTMMGCLVFDFMIPSLKQLKARRSEIIWMALGLLLTQVVIKGL